MQYSHRVLNNTYYISTPCTLAAVYTIHSLPLGYATLTRCIKILPDFLTQIMPYLKPEPGMQNEILTVEAITFREAVQLVFDAFQSWNSNNDLDPGDTFRIIAKLLDTLGGLGAGDKFRFWAKLIDFG